MTAKLSAEELADILSNEAAPAMVERESLNDATRECLQLAILDAAAELSRLSAQVREAEAERRMLIAAIAAINPFDNDGGEPNEFFCLWCKQSHDRYKITPAQAVCDEHPDLHAADCVWLMARLEREPPQTQQEGSEG